MDELPPLARRLRRLAWLVTAFAIGAAVLGFWPHGFDIVERSVKGNRILGETTSRAGGYSIAGWAFFQAVVCSTVRIDPTRRTGWKAFVISILLAVGGGIAYLVEQFTLSDQIPLWPAQVMTGCIGCALVLTTFALPVILIVSKHLPPDVPPARVHSSG